MANTLQPETALLVSGSRRPSQRIFCLLSCTVVAALGIGCEGDRERGDAATRNGRHDQEHPLVMVGEDHVVHAEPNVFHAVRVRLRNVTDQTIVGATPRLPCNCHIVAALPREFPPGGTFETTFKVLTPVRGAKRFEIEFHDGSHALAGVAVFQIEVSGAIPDVVKLPPSVQLIHVSREPNQYFVELETVEESGAAAFVESADFGEHVGIVASAPRLVHSQPFNRNLVLQRYQVPVTVETTEPGDDSADLRVHVTGGGDSRLIRVQVRVLPRAHVSPSSIEFPVTSATGVAATFRVIARIAGDEYRINTFDHDLVSVEPSGEGDSQWVLTCLKPGAAGLRSSVTLTSTAGETIVLPVQWR